VENLTFSIDISVQIQDLGLKC